ncbi:MAG: glycosyltransferase family 1 protein [Planctomycetota bacterium]
MKIAIDVSIQDTPYLTGVEKVQRSILREIAQIDSENEYLLLTKKPVKLGFDLPPNFRMLDLLPHGPSYLWRELFVPPVLNKEKVAVYHSPVSAIPVIGKAKKIATVHELPWVERDRGDASAKTGHRVWLFLNTRYAERIIAISERTRANILQLYPDAAAKVVVIHNGVDERFRSLHEEPSAIDRTAFLQRFGVAEGPFLLFVGSLRRKKNLNALLDAFEALPAPEKSDLRLVLVGIRNTAWGDLKKRLNSPVLRNRVYFPGYVSDEDLVVLYNLALALVYPSRFEGFGLPPLEAMACGTPVITSSGGAIPEVVGDAAILLEPSDKAGLTEAMVRICRDQALRAQMIDKGFERARKFSWRKAALAVLQLYRELAE